MGDNADDLYDRYFDDHYDDTMHINMSVKGSLVRSTEKALLWKRLNQVAYWIPKSCVVDIDHDYIVVSQWISNLLQWEEDS